MAPLFLLTPYSLAWSPLFAAYNGYLNYGVVRQRIGRKMYLGDQSAVQGSAEDKHAFQIALRAQQNFAEHVPWTYLLISLAEINGAPSGLINTALGLLFVLRVSHVEFGLKQQNAVGTGRTLGFLGTVAIGVGAGLYNLTLSWDFILTSLGIRR